MKLETMGTAPAGAEPARPRRVRGTGPANPEADRLVRQAAAICALVFGPPADRRFAIRYWGSGRVERPAGIPDFTLSLETPDALRRMLLPPSELRLARAFLQGDFEIEGSLEAAVRLGARVRDRLSVPGRLVRLIGLLLALPVPAPRLRPRSRRRVRSAHRHSRARDAGAVRAHYDLGNEFFALWLDRAMVYSCAYFETGNEDIHAAQAAKLDYLCRKLRLRPGERLLDIGCGWGGLLAHAARYYGVAGFGISLSPAQVELATQRMAGSGLEGRCRFVVADYRDLTDLPPFDKVVSVGMCEHVGRSHLGEYFTHAFRLTRPGGLFLNHCIVTGHTQAPTLRRHLWREGAFIERYVFPGGELPALNQLVRTAERCGFETRDTESLREHYTRTLRHWVGRLERAREAAVRAVGPEVYRTWRLYMAGSAAGFEAGRLNLAQVLFARPDREGHVTVPLTRADLYRPVKHRGDGPSPAPA